jgi:DNA topoisomerase-3
MNKEFSAGYRKWASCSPLALFTAKVENHCLENFLPIKTTLEQEAAVSSLLILWTDGDREGEAIAHEIMEVCCCVNSRLRVYRARFSEITPQSIYRACQHLGTINQNVVDAVDVRQELDLRIGAAFTRFQTLYLKKKFPNALSESLISYGSCQFPTLGFVTERFKQIEDFVPESFHKIAVTYETEDDVVVFRWKRIRVFRRLACQILYEMCMENPTARVLSIDSRHKSKWRPQALDTVELEKLASRKLHINAKETMRIAEKLYTQGFISYPRTETNIFPSTMDLNSIVQEQTQDQHWGGFAAGILTQGGANPRNGSKTDNAHPPIHPTKHASHLQGNEQRIYELVTRHFLACCSKDAQGQETTVEIEIAGERFTAQGLMVTVRNYLDVYPYDRWSDKTIPLFQQDQTFQPTRLEMVEGETTPPSPLQEADLIALMEKHGIGTDATHAEHIETIKLREYVGCTTDGSFLPAQLGLGLVNGYDAMGFQMSKPYLRAELEADLRCICNGEKRKEDVLTVQTQKYRDVFIKACEQAHLLDEALHEFFGEPADIPQEEVTPSMEDIVVRHCPSCGNADMLLRVSKEGRYFIGCAEYPLCRACAFFPRSVIHVTVTKDVCSRVASCSFLLPSKWIRGRYCISSVVHLQCLKFD